MRLLSNRFRAWSKMVNCICHDTEPTSAPSLCLRPSNAAEPLDLTERSDAGRTGIRPRPVGGTTEPKNAARADARCSAPRSAACGAVAGLHRLVGGADPRRSAVDLTRDRAMDRGRGRAARAHGPRLADVRPHPAQGAERFTRSVIAMRAESRRSKPCSKSSRSESTTAAPS